MAASNDMFLVLLGWYEDDSDENPFSVSRESFFCGSSSKPYTREQAWGYVQAARAKAARKATIDLVDIEVITFADRKTVWEWHK